MSALTGSDRIEELKANGWKSVDGSDNQAHSAAAMGHKVHAAAPCEGIAIKHNKHHSDADLLDRTEQLVKETSARIQTFTSEESKALSGFFMAVVEAQDAAKDALITQLDEMMKSCEKKESAEIRDKLFALYQAHHAEVLADKLFQMDALELPLPTNERLIFLAVLKKLPTVDHESKWPTDQLFLVFKLVSCMLISAYIHSKLREMVKADH